MKEQFLQELKELLSKYNASIGFTCAPGSDTYGIDDGGIQIDINDKEILKVSYWWLCPNDL